MHLYIFVLMISTTIRASENSCSQQVDSAREQCQKAIGEVSTTSESDQSSGNLALDAATQSSRSNIGRNALNQAVGLCFSAKQACQRVCNPSSSLNLPQGNLGLAPGLGGSNGPEAGDANHGIFNDGSHKCTAADLEAVTSNGLTGYIPHKGHDCNGSPLVLQIPFMGRTPAALDLSSQAAGVLFDILNLGENTTEQISWLRPKARATNLFLALPDASGRVLGVQQLFGDFTVGPDGRTAENGFLALAKYDGLGEDGVVSRADGRIDDRDLVFRRLRLWADLNGDGIAQSNELVPLADAHVTAIDLSYDPNFLEQDIYGNQIRYKSVVETDDGEAHVIFDLFFHLESVGGV